MAKRFIPSPHDKVFRAAMSYPKVAREFLETHLPKDLCSKIDFNSLEVCPNSFIDKELRLSQADVLIKALIDGKEAYIYVLAEHQSTPDKYMPLRLIKYQTKIWDFLIQQQKDDGCIAPLPVIVPLIFFTGSGAYNAALTMWDLCGEHADLMKSIWTSPILVIEVDAMPGTKLIARKFAGTMEYIMRERFRRDVAHGLIAIAANLDYLISLKDGKLIEEYLTYIFNFDENHESIQDLMIDIHEKVSRDVEGEMASLAEKLVKEGETKGKLEGKLETAENMLEMGSDPIFVVKATGLTLEQVKNLQKKR